MCIFSALGRERDTDFVVLQISQNLLEEEGALLNFGRAAVLSRSCLVFFCKMRGFVVFLFG